MKVAVIIPARDEEESLQATLGALSNRNVDRVIVVDNGSSDGTATVARSLGATTVFESRVGYGSACQRGIRALSADAAACSGAEPDVLVFIDADDAAAPAQLEQILEPIRSGAADLVLGRRDGASASLARHARMGNRLVSAALRRLYGSETRDLGPFRAVRFDVLRDLELDDPDFGWNVQMQVRALRRGYRIVEIPVEWERRTAGTSKITGSLLGSAAAAWGMLSTLIREAARGSSAQDRVSREET